MLRREKFETFIFWNYFFNVISCCCFLIWLDQNYSMSNLIAVVLFYFITMRELFLFLFWCLSWALSWGVCRLLVTNVVKPRRGKHNLKEVQNFAGNSLFLNLTLNKGCPKRGPRALNKGCPKRGPRAHFHIANDLVSGCVVYLPPKLELLFCVEMAKVSCYKVKNWFALRDITQGQKKIEWKFSCF